MLVFACFLAWCCAGMASAGSVTAQEAPGHGGLELQMEEGILSVEPRSDRVIHVRFGPAGYAGNYNPAAIAAPARTDFKLTATADTYTLATAKVQVRVDRKTGAVHFLTRQGAAILEEAGRELGPGVAQSFQTRAIVYGLGQHQNGLLDYSGTTVHLQQQNKDVAVPMLVSPNGFGILWNNASVTDVDVGRPDSPHPLVIRSEAGGGVDYDFIYGPELDEIIGAYRGLTGDAPMMARWTWGLWQSKERYQTQAQLLSVAAQYRSMGAPLDAVIQDWQYWEPGQWGSHRFDAARFPDPGAMVRTLHEEHVHTIISVWPRFDLGTANAAELDQAGALFPKVYPNVYPPGQGRWYDAWNPAGRAIYWRQIMRELGKLDFDGWWLDASEAELGGNWGEMRELNTAAGAGASVYNAYPLLHTSAVHDGMTRDMPSKRPFILTRSAYAGQQRNAAVTWSGDTNGDWETLRRQPPAALNFSMSGIPYWCSDIGGFVGGDPKDPAYAELFTRWYEFAVFTPMFRVHGTGPGKELWAFDDATRNVLLDNDRLRYRLLPYLYSASWEVTSKHGTMMRALAFDFRDDPKALRIADEFMFGRALLVAPVLEPGVDARAVYLPGREPWYDFRTGERAQGGQKVTARADIAAIPVYVRAGSILPLGPVKPYADAPTAEPLEIRVYPGKDGAYELYDDAGDGDGYQRGEYALVHLSWTDAGRRLDIAPRRGSFPGMSAEQVFSVRCGRGNGQARTVTYTGKAMSVVLSACAP